MGVSRTLVRIFPLVRFIFKKCFFFPKEKQRDTAEVATQARKVGVPPRRLGHPGRYLTLVRLYKKRFLHLPTRICAVRKSDEKWRQYYLFPNLLVSSWVILDVLRERVLYRL